MRRASEIASLSPPVCRGATTLAESHHGTRAGLRESKGGRLSTEQQIGLMRREYTLDAGEAFDAILRTCESPIERLFLAYAVSQGWKQPDQGAWCMARDTMGSTPDAPVRYGTMLVPAETDNGHEFIVTQMVIGGFRLDFALFTWDDRLAIETDGHDFHERTKEQAARDRSRDRAFTADGWKVLRFTGSELHRSVESCWNEVDRLREAAWQAAYARETALR